MTRLMQAHCDSPCVSSSPPVSFAFGISRHLTLVTLSTMSKYPCTAAVPKGEWPKSASNKQTPADHTSDSKVYLHMLQHRLQHATNVTKAGCGRLCVKYAHLSPSSRSGAM
jgi:hypothetical protein